MFFQQKFASERRVGLPKILEGSGTFEGVQEQPSSAQGKTQPKESLMAKRRQLLVQLKGPGESGRWLSVHS